MSARNIAISLALLLPVQLRGQDHTHQPGMTHPAATTPAAPTRPGQAAFAAIAEIVAILRADSTTDWTKVDIEGLRQHLIDMDDVTMRAVVRQEAIASGARFTVTGQGRTTAAIQRMAKAHAAMVSASDSMRVSVEEVTGGAVVTVVATPATAQAVARIRGLGFHGLLTLGDHHGPHHLAMARGMTDHSHK
ncbi:MAG TPA: hypothetical protein VIK50_15235 [Gemmatimonadaceae bacterium]